MQVELNFDSAISLLSFVQAILLGAFFLTYKKGNRNANVYLGVFIISYYFEDLYAFFGSSMLIAEYHFLIFFPSLALFAYGPSLYLYVASTVKEKFDVSKKYLIISFAPLVLELIAGLVLFLQPDGTKLELITSEQFNLIHHIYSLIAGLHALAYVTAAYRLTNRYESPDHGNTIRQVKWLTYFLLFFIVRFSVWVIIKVAILFGGTFDIDFNNFFAITIDVLTISSLIVIYTMSYFSISNINLVSGFLQRMKYSGSTPDDDKERELLEKLKNALEVENKFTNPDLKIADLAAEFNTNSKYLSQVINKQHEVNFTQLVNAYRVGMVKERMNDPQYNHLTLLAIAEDCGFTSKSTFVRAFKNQTGMLPKEYKQKK